jgi:23S rRNA (guanosine2251-2'-O)-methyltransferase
MTRGATTDGPLVVYGTNAVRELLRSEVPVTRVYVAPRAGGAALESEARSRGVAVETAERSRLDRLAGSPHHQGVVATGPPFAYEPLDRLLDPGCPSALVLDGVQDPRNLGAILRTARAVAVGGVVLPRDRSAGVTSAVVAAAAGLLFGLPIARVPNLVRAMAQMKSAGYWLTGLVPRGGEAVFRASPPDRLGLVVGGEGEGLRVLVRRSCDFTVSVPMASGVESLNVAVAVGIALYELVVRRAASDRVKHGSSRSIS